MSHVWEENEPEHSVCDCCDKNIPLSHGTAQVPIDEALNIPDFNGYPARGINIDMDLCPDCTVAIGAVIDHMIKALRFRKQP